MQEFERARREINGQGVLITSWFDTEHRHWRANAPAFQHLLNDIDASALSGSTREDAIAAMEQRLGQRITTR